MATRATPDDENHGAIVGAGLPAIDGDYRGQARSYGNKVISQQYSTLNFDVIMI